MRHIIIAASIITILFITPLAYMLADNQPPYVYDTENSYIVPQQNRVDHQATAHWSFKRVNRLCPGLVYRVIVDVNSGAQTIFDPVPASVISMKATYINRTFTLPPNLAPGPQLYRAHIAFRCNALQRFWPLMVRTPDLPFQVVP